MHKLSLSLAAGTALLTVAALGCANIAHADGMAPKGRPVAAEMPTNWSGVYFGVQSGYQWSSIDGGYDGGPLVNEVDFDSGLVGAHLGIQHQFGAVVLGVEGTWLSAIRDNPGSTVCPNPAFVCTHKLNDILTIGGRVGWAAGHWMPYVTGGYATARLEAFHFIPPGGANATNEAAGTRNDGWFVGGGFEWVVSPGWTTGLEYRHYEFDEASGAWFRPGVPQVLGTYQMDATVDTVTARVTWRWGRPEPKPLK